MVSTASLLHQHLIFVLWIFSFMYILVHNLIFVFWQLEKFKRQLMQSLNDEISPVWFPDKLVSIFCPVNFIKSSQTWQFLSFCDHFLYCALWLLNFCLISKQKLLILALMTNQFPMAILQRVILSFNSTFEVIIFVGNFRWYLMNLFDNS